MLFKHYVTRGKSIKYKKKKWKDLWRPYLASYHLPGWHISSKRIDHQAAFWKKFSLDSTLGLLLPYLHHARWLNLRVEQKTMHQKVCKEKSLMDRRSFLYVATTISKALLVVITFEKNFKRIAGGLASTTLNHSFWTSARFKKNLDVCPAKYCWLFSNGIAPEILFRWTTI